MVFDPDKQLPRTPSTSNDELFDALVRHQIFLLRSAGSLRNETIRLLDATEKNVADLIVRRLTAGGSLSQQLSRARSLMQAIRKVRGQGWDEIDNLWASTMNSLIKEESINTGKIFSATSPVQMELAFPSNTLLRSIVASAPFEGKTLREWSSNVRRADLRRIEDQIKIGLVQGESGVQIARRVVGTTALRGANGVTQLARNDAATITRTATNAIANFGRREFFRSNRGLMTGEMYVATLDGRTTAICRSLDGKIFEVTEGPIPPLHLNCRSLRVATMDAQVLGRRPMKPTTERQLLREFSGARGLRGVRSRSDLPVGTKSAFDKFARRRVREIVGTVPAKVSYQEWLRRQSVQFQNDVLGTTKARLFRRGELDLDKFVNRQGDELTLSQLALRERQSFIDAGLDPDQF